MKKTILIISIAGILVAGFANAYFSQWWKTVKDFLPRVDNEVDIGSDSKRVQDYYGYNIDVKAITTDSFSDGTLTITGGDLTTTGTLYPRYIGDSDNLVWAGYFDVLEGGSLDITEGTFTSTLNIMGTGLFVDNIVEYSDGAGVTIEALLEVASAGTDYFAITNLTEGDILLVDSVGDLTTTGNIAGANIIVNDAEAGNTGLILKGTGSASGSRGGFIEHYSNAETIAGYTYTNFYNQFVWDSSAQSVLNSTGVAFVDFVDGSASFASGDLTIDSDGNLTTTGTVTAEQLTVNHIAERTGAHGIEFDDNVGIGTTPSATLDVSGEVNITGSAGSGGAAPDVLTVVGGDGDATEAGSSINFTTGKGGDGNGSSAGASGDINFTTSIGGDAYGNASDGGDILFTTGAGGDGDAPGDGGDVIFDLGAAGAGIGPPDGRQGQAWFKGLLAFGTAGVTKIEDDGSDLVIKTDARYVRGFLADNFLDFNFVQSPVETATPDGFKYTGNPHGYGSVPAIDGSDVVFAIGDGLDAESGDNDGGKGGDFWATLGDGGTESGTGDTGRKGVFGIEITEPIFVDDAIQFQVGTGAYFSGDVAIGTGAAPTLALDVNGSMIVTDSAQFGTTGKFTIEEDGDSFWSGSGSGLVFGHMYADNISETVSILGTDSYSDVAASISGGETNNVTFQNSKEFLITKAGKYSIVWSMSITTTTANDEVEGTVTINSIPTMTATAHTLVKNGNVSVAFSGVTILDLSIGDLVRFGVLNHTATRDVKVEHANMIIRQEGG